MEQWEGEDSGKGALPKNTGAAGSTAGNTRYVSYFVQNCMPLVLSKTLSN